MADMFGTPVGTRAWEQDWRSNLTTGAGVAESLGRIAMQPAQQRKLSAEAEKLETELQQERSLAALVQAQAGVQQEDGEAPRSMAGQLDSLAQAAMGAGLVTKGTEFAKAAAEIRAKESTAANQAASRAKAALQTMREKIELEAQTFGDVKSPNDWARANALYQFQTGEPGPYSEVEYSPELITQIRDNGVSAKEQLDLQEKQLVRLETKAYRDRRLGQHDATLDLRKLQLDLAKIREARLAKAGSGKQTSQPGGNELAQVKRLVKRDFGESGLNDIDLNDAAYTIAAEARGLMKQNPALDGAMAIQQAYNNARQSGDFEGPAGIKLPLVGRVTVGTGRYTGGGKTAATAMLLPEEPKAADLKQGRYYVSPSGVVGKWTGKGFEVTGRALQDDNGRENNEEEEE